MSVLYTLHWNEKHGMTKVNERVLKRTCQDEDTARAWVFPHQN